MTLIRWSPASLHPARDIFNIQDEVNRLFDTFNRGSIRADFGNTFTPAVDIEETSEGFRIRVDLPGIDQNDVKVSLMGDTLTIRGERRQDATQKEGNFHRIERSHGVFERSFTLGAQVRNDGVKAQYKDGVLEVIVPKAEEAKVREIEIKVG